MLTYFQGSWGQCEVQSNTSKKKWKKERDQEDQWLPRDKVLGCIYMCTPRHLREEVGQAVWDERRKQNGCWKWLLPNNNEGHTDSTQVSLRTTLPLCLGVPSEWQVEHLLLLWYLFFESSQQHWEHLTLALTFFAKGHSSMNWKAIIWNINSQWPQLLQQLL